MGDPHRGVGGVDTLAARAGRAVDVHPDVLLVDLHLVGRFDHRHHIHPGKAGLPAVLVVERGDADQAVGAVLAGQRPVRVRGLYHERGRLDAGLFGVGGVVDGRGVAVALRPAQVHPHQHLRPVGGVHPSGLGLDRDQRVPLVVVAGQQRPHLELVDLPAQPPGFRLHLDPGRRVVLGLSQLVQHLDVVQPAPQLGHPPDVALNMGQPAGHPLGGLRVVPQAGAAGPLFEVGRLPAERAKIEHGLDAGQRRGQLLELGGDVDGHGIAGYAAAPDRAVAAGVGMPWPPRPAGAANAVRPGLTGTDQIRPGHSPTSATAPARRQHRSRRWPPGTDPRCSYGGRRPAPGEP